MRKVLWLILILSIIFLIPLIFLRVSNEINNNSVILAFDIEKFAIDSGNLEHINLSGLKEYGISSVIVNGKLDGADIELLEKVNSYGLQIILQLNSLAKSKEYYKNLEQYIKIFDIRYLLISGYDGEKAYGEVQYMDEGIGELAELINRNNLVFFTMENKEQTGCVRVPGLEKLIDETDYSLNRAFTISEYKSKVSDVKDACMIWLRAVVDRNIRLISIEPIFISKDSTEYGQALEVLEASKKLSEFLVNKGFVINQPIKKGNAGIPKGYYSIPLFINIIVSMALLLDYSGIKRRWIYVFLTVAPVFSSIMLFAFIPENNIYAAFAAAVIYPSMSSALLLKSLESPSKNFFILIMKSLLIILAVNGMGSCSVIASMCDIRYTMGLINFMPVIPAFIIPLIVFNINFIFKSLKQSTLFDRIFMDVKNCGIKKFIISNLIYVIACCAFISVYLLRSGNFNILPEFPLEIKVREFLELTMSARPRTKEFAIAYPSLFAFLYFYPKKVKGKFLCFLGTLSTIIGISVINSFCHGFTPVLTSLNRTFNGLFLGIITGCICLIICRFIYKFFDIE